MMLKILSAHYIDIMKAFSGVERMSLLSGSASSGGEEPGFAEVVFLSSSPPGITSLTVFLRHGQLDLSNASDNISDYMISIFPDFSSFSVF